MSVVHDDDRVTVTGVETCEAAECHSHGLPAGYSWTGRPEPTVHAAFVAAHTPHGFRAAPREDTR